MKHILLIRHGQASYFNRNYDQLSDTGRMQAAQIGDHFAANNMSMHQVFVGPRQRHRGTWEQIESKVKAAQHTVGPITIRQHLDELPAFEIVNAVSADLFEEKPELKEGFKPDGTPKDPKAHGMAFRIVLDRWAEDYWNLPTLESYQEFEHRIVCEFNHAVDAIEDGQTAILITSGGPITVALRSFGGMHTESFSSVAFSIWNGSISHMAWSNGEFSIAQWNLTSHFRSSDLVTSI